MCILCVFIYFTSRNNNSKYPSLVAHSLVRCIENYFMVDPSTTRAIYALKYGSSAGNKRGATDGGRLYNIPRVPLIEVHRCQSTSSAVENSSLSSSLWTSFLSLLQMLRLSCPTNKSSRRAHQLNSFPAIKNTQH